MARIAVPRTARRQCCGALGAPGAARLFTARSGGGGAARGGGASPSASALAEAPFEAPSTSYAEQEQQQGGDGGAPAYRANLDFKFVRDNLELVQRNCRDRAVGAADPAKVAALYEDFVALQRETDAVRAARNENSAAMKVGNLTPARHLPAWLIPGLPFVAGLGQRGPLAGWLAG